VGKYVIAYILEIVSANFQAFLCPLSGVVDVRVIARIFGGAHGPHFVACRPGPQGDKAMLIHPHSRQWLKATTEEFDKLLHNGTAQVVPIPDDVHWRDILPLTWVWKHKTNEDGYLIKHKARLCVRGDLEKLPSTEETFAATLAARVFRALMAIAAYFDLELQQLDAISTFTNSILRRKLYVRLPDGFHQQHKYLLLLRALYGFKESGHLWFKEFTGTLGDLGLQCSADEQCLWYNDWLVLFFFVDDVVAMFRRIYTDKWDQFKADLCSSYEFKDLGDLKWFLGVRVIRDRPNRKLRLCQDAYISKIARKFHHLGPQMGNTDGPRRARYPPAGSATLEADNLQLPVAYRVT
jgi:hypothetical protein